jgi:uncharacterized protein YndB with AHSA1/START domain
MQDEKNNVFTEIQINASTEEVWSVLTDWNKLKDWSSSFIGISTSKLIKGEKFISYFKNPLTGGTMELEHICLDYEEGRKFGWSGDIVGKTQDHHIYSLESTKYGTTIFKQEDGLHGPHSRLLNFLAEHHMTSMYKKFNQELKERVESLFPRD